MFISTFVNSNNEMWILDVAVIKVQWRALNSVLNTTPNMDYHAIHSFLFLFIRLVLFQVAEETVKV